MPNLWTDIPNDDVWWEQAYNLFLEANPLQTLEQHMSYVYSGDGWNDYGFHIQTTINLGAQVPFYNGVLKKAILIVVARARKMHHADWNVLDDVNPEHPHEALTTEQTLLINSIVHPL